MRKLKLVGLSADGRQAVFVDDTGAEFATPADDKLRAALRGDRARLGQLEIEMDSVLRPRDIQARIRAGESADAVAALAQVSVEKIMPYCLPVLAERQHVADLAQRSHVRRKNVEGPSKRLADVVAERLRSRGVDPTSASWEAWRRDDGRWSVQAAYQSGERPRSALFVFDTVGRYSQAEDDEAKWLTGERQSTRKGPQPRPSGRTETGGESQPSSRRLAAVQDGDRMLRLQPELGSSDDDAPYDDDAGDDTSDDLTAVVRAVQADVELTAPDTADPDDDAGEHDVDETGVDETGVGGSETPAPEPAATVTQDVQTEAVPERRRRSNRRASVPSWDEIMFGKGKDE